MVVKTKYDYGVWFNSHHSTKFYLDVIEKVISFPEKDKNIVPIPMTSKTYDFSSFYGSQPYKQREIKLVFLIQNWQDLTKDALYNKWTVVVNWLMQPNGLTTLVDDIMPQYQYRVEVQKAPEFKEARTKGTLTVYFTAYPFRIDALPEGHDLVAFMNTKLDVRQQTNFTFKSYWSSFKELNIGDRATYGAWATQYYNPNSPTGDGGDKINPTFHGYTYPIVDKITVAYSDRRPSRFAYKLANHSQWLLEQDVLQAQNEYLDVILVNNGISEVVPTITNNSSVTIVRDDEIYNLQPGVVETEKFVLKPGENHLKMYIANITLNIDFKFHKELI